MKIEISNTHEKRTEFIKWANCNNYNASISVDKNTYIDGQPCGNKMSKIWDAFYCDNPLEANNFCVVKQIIAIDANGDRILKNRGERLPPSVGGYDLVTEYHVISRYNYTPETLRGQETPVVSTHTKLSDAVNSILAAKWFNKQFEIYCSSGLANTHECITAGLRTRK